MAVHQEADIHALDLTRYFYTNIVGQAKVLAHRRTANEVQSPDIDEAFDQFVVKERGQRLKDAATVGGGAALGAGGQGLIEAVSTGSTIKVAIYLVSLLIGASLAGWGIFG